MNRRGFFARVIGTMGAILGVKLKPDSNCEGFLYSKAGAGKVRSSSPNVAQLTPHEPNWQTMDKRIFLGDSKVEDSNSIRT